VLYSTGMYAPVFVYCNVCNCCCRAVVSVSVSSTICYPYELSVDPVVICGLHVVVDA